MEKDLARTVPFDQYSRQFEVASIIDELRKKGQSFNILDVGGYKGRTADFFPKDKVVILDVFDVEEPNYIKGDGKELPFKDGEFDIVVNFDVLEHIPKKDRNKFLDECLRVAKHTAIISAPHKTIENQTAEKLLNDYYQNLHDEPHRWLKEHIDFIIPDFKQVEARIRNAGWETFSLPSNDTLLWLMMQNAIFLNSKFPLNSPGIVGLNEYYNIHFHYDGGESLDLTYRTILCATKNKDLAERLRLKLQKKNHPLTLSERLNLAHKIHLYYSDLVVKLAQQAKNYEELHAHEAKRAEELHNNSVLLWERINKLESRLALERTKRIGSRLKQKLQDTKQKHDRHDKENA